MRWAGWHPIGEDEITLAEIMAHARYRTGLVTDGFHQFRPSMNFHRRFQQFQWIRGQQDDWWQTSSAASSLRWQIRRRPVAFKGPSHNKCRPSGIVRIMSDRIEGVIRRKRIRFEPTENH